MLSMDRVLVKRQILAPHTFKTGWPDGPGASVLTSHPPSGHIFK